MKIQIGKRWVRLEDATPLELLYDRLGDEIENLETEKRLAGYKIQERRAQCAALLKLITKKEST